MTYKEAIEKELEINFKISFEEASKRIEGLKEKTFNNVKSQWKKRNRDSSGINGKKPKTKNIPERELNSPLTFIDDPDELLLSVSTRMLNKPDPDPRWGSLLISVRKENIGKSKKEGNIQSKFKSMSISEVSKILARKRENISLKKDLKESS